MDYNWNWGVLFQDPFFDWLVLGVQWTFAVALAAWVIALTVGIIVGVGRTLPIRPVAAICTGYVELFRNVPLLVQMFIWYFVVPELVPDDLGRWMKRDMPNPEYTTAVIALGLDTAGRTDDQARLGVQDTRGKFVGGEPAEHH